jgi:hypothetical protein
MSVYLIKGKYTIPGFLYWAVASWAVALTFLTILGLAGWAYELSAHVEVLREMPSWVRALLDICGAYAAIGAICLYMSMWIYWIAVERASWLVRIGWLLALLLGLHYGALVYAFAASRGMVRVDGTVGVVGGG